MAVIHVMVFVLYLEGLLSSFILLVLYQCVLPVLRWPDAFASRPV